jgi:hypothetical protein
MVEQLDGLLERAGVVHCLIALAKALRGANDRTRLAAFRADDKHRGYVREYLANQLMDLAAFWPVQLPEAAQR